MATRTVLNDLTFFKGGAVCAEKAVQFKVMAGEVTDSKGAGEALISLWNYATGKVDVLSVEAQYVPDSPFNLVSAVCLEDKYGLYGQLLDRELVSTSGTSQYKLVRDGNIFILPEYVDAEAACPTVHQKVFRDVVNWKFTDFDRWNAEKGPFTVDMCADKHNSQLPEFYSEENSVFNHTLAGRSFYANMPYVDIFIGRLLVKIFTDFAKDPAHTKFLLVLPHKPHAVWWGLTKKLEELQTYSKGSVIFSASKDQCYRVEELTESEPGRVWIQGTPWPVTVFYLDQFTVGRVDAKVLAHLRLGHLCDRYIDVMDMQGVNLGVSSDELRASEVTRCSERCMSCQVSKVTRPSQTADRGRVPKSVRKTVEKRQPSSRLGQLTFTDHGGPFEISLGGYRGYTIHVDDYSGLGHIYFWKRKLEYLPALQLYRDFVQTTGRAIMGEDSRVEELVYDLDLLVIQSDNDSTIIAGQAAEYCRQNSILRRTTAPYLHENNARVESYNRLLQAKARAMLMTGGLCAGMWPLAFRHAVYLLNRVVKAELGMRSTMDVLQQKVDLSNLRIFGCRAYAFIDKSLRTKLADRATPLLYVGHDDRSTSYLLYCTTRNRVVRSGMVRFDERVNDVGKLVLSWDPSVVVPLRSLFDCVQLDAPYFEKFTGSPTSVLEIAIYAPPDSDEFTGVVKLQSRASTFWTPVSCFLEQSVTNLELLRQILDGQNVNRFYPVFAFAEVQLTSGAEWEEAVVCANARGEHRLPYQVLLLRHCGRTGKSVDVAKTSICFQVQHVALAAVQQQWMPNGVSCPKTWRQLVNAPDAVQWQASDYKEECALIDVKHAIVPVKNLPAGVKPLGMKAVYKAKFDAANVLTERKSRWVVCGNKQTHGVNYEEVYSPCTQLNTLRILLQLGLILGLLSFTMDVITCFLNGDLDLDNPLFVRWPDGRMVRGTYFGRLAKSVYGLKQAPRVWYFTLKRWILLYDAMLAVSNIDPCLFYICRPNELIVFIYIHVDNFLILTSSEAWKDNFFTSFNSTYPSVDEGVLSDILGMRMTFRDAGLVRECRMSQHGLIHRILKRYGMTDCNPALSPMEPKLSLMPADPQEPALSYPYANLAMELMWLARCTRPDILTAVCYMARFMHCFDATHWQHLLRMLRYLKGTIDDCLTLQCSSPASHTAVLEISAYSDADHAADKVTRRSVTGSLVRLNGSTVMYSSKLQKTVAVSTADGELVALSETAREIEHVVNLLSEFAPVKLPVVLHGDNHASVIQAESTLNNTATRHIAVRDRYVAKLAELGRILIVKVPSAENLADFFTKSMPVDRFLVLRAIVLRFFRS
ncbi:hypothetical protein CYMTET_27813 [Cymbomonas tetramitiformis]|uniref:Integrase catalytic domain-containing protein n=1 Tax=Cymbomonas tetramitiformis TaxID=36881 RepID=A0AAE0FQM0_9CHLO|nr:hypothetical protein CYMTET_27813 [Cymbomonas tetramitiformis]